MAAEQPNRVSVLLGRWHAVGAERADAGGDAVQLLAAREQVEFTASVVIARARFTQAGALRWRIRFDTGLAPDITVAARIDQANRAAQDFYILPTWTWQPRLRLAEENGLSLDAYRFETLDVLSTRWRRGHVFRRLRDGKSEAAGRIDPDQSGCDP